MNINTCFKTAPQNPELAIWVKRQRQAKVQGVLNQERITILEMLQFDFGGNAQLTHDWERRFDELVDWVLACVERGKPVDWGLMSWGVEGGGRGLHLAMWAQLQVRARLGLGLSCVESMNWANSD